MKWLTEFSTNLGSVSIGLVMLSAAFGQTIQIIPGSTNDVGYSKGTTVQTIPAFIPLPSLPPGTQSTLRQGQRFAYSIQVPIAGPYIVMLGFVEPTVGGMGKRVFSVSANDQPILQNLDVFAEVGALAPLVKTALLYIPGNLTLYFSASVRTAIISLIEITPYPIQQPNLMPTAPPNSFDSSRQ
jgi:Malectin domain